MKPGDLVELDTIHVLPRGGERFYVYTLIDVVSRWAYAKTVTKINTHQSLRFLREAQGRAPFSFSTLQSDHGSEFSTNSSERSHLVHRHSRVRQPNDNGHLERFNRTVQEECLHRVPRTPWHYRRALQNYLPYYNTERLHLGLNLKTPSRWFQGID
ncbi:MAG: integrase core domain-containing protein [Bacteroidota bacterium]